MELIKILLPILYMIMIFCNEQKPQQESYKDEVIYIPNSAIDSNGDTTLQDWMRMENYI